MLPLTKNRIIYSILGVLLCLVGKDGFGQKEANNWYFEYTAGISFNSGTPEALIDNAFQGYASGGSSCISDTSGNLLFYTDGTTIFNHNHEMMENGSGLEGDNSGSQTAIIFKVPGSTDRYYVFTVGSRNENFGLSYSIVDMKGDNGNGTVILKNIRLQGAIWARDKLTAVKHANNRDYWVISRIIWDNHFASFLVTPNGVDPNPVLSETRYIDNTRWYGPIKVSHDRKKLISCHRAVNGYSHGSFEVCDFDCTTGQIQYNFFIKEDNGNSSGFGVTGVELSPDSKLLYITCKAFPNSTGSATLQYDLTQQDSINFVASVKIIDTTTLTNGIQLGSDGKIYGIRFLYPQTDTLFYYLDVINNVWEKGTDSNFESYKINLQNRKGVDNLPNFPQDLLYRFVWSGGLCAGVPFNFRHRFIPEPDSIHWDFGDPGSGAANTSTIHNPTHVFSAGGTFEVYTYVKYPNGRIEETSREVEVLPKPYPNLGPDTLVCENAAVSLTPGSGFAGYYWNGSIMPGSPTYLASDTGTYIVRVKNNLGCYNADTINVLQRPAPTLDQTNLNIAPTTCSGTTGAITGLQVLGNPPLTFQWTASGTPITIHSIYTTSAWGFTNLMLPMATAAKTPWPPTPSAMRATYLFIPLPQRPPFATIPMARLP